MKSRLISLFLTLVLVLCPLAVSAVDATLDESTDFSGTCFSFSFSGQQPVEDEQTMLIISYNDKNQIVGFQALDVVGWSRYHQFPVDVDHYLTPENGGTTLKAFLWDEELRPFATGTVLGKTTQTGLLAPTVCTFYENKAGALSITFDDGNYPSAQYYNSEFKKYGLNGTAMLVVNNVKNNVDQWKSLLQEGYIDIGNHSATHAIKYASDSVTQEQLEADITDAYTQLKTWFPEQKILSFATPWGQTSTNSIAEIKKNHFSNRIAGGGLQNANPQGEEWYKLKAFTYENKYTASDMNTWADQAISNKGWVIELLHDCTKSNPGTYTITEDIFHDHMEYLATKKDDLWVGTFNEVTAYIKERQNASVTIDWANGQTMALTVTDSLPDEQFSQPLTLRVNVPLSWKNGAAYLQGAAAGSSPVVYEEPGRRYVQINVVPDGGQVILQKR